MAVNLVSLVMQFMTPDVISRVAAALGLDRGKTQSAIGAAVPGLLAGFSNLATQPEGAERLADTIRQQSGMLGSFTSMLGTGGTALAEKGTQLLSSLLGTRDETALAGAVGRYAGISQGASDSLLGMMAPIVMGTIANQPGGRDIDGRGIANFLASQKDSIVSALPSGFSSLLGGTGLLDSLGGAARTAASVGAQTFRTAASTASTTAPRTIDTTAGVVRRTAEAAPSGLSWLYWAIPAAALAALLIYLLWPAQQTVPTGVGTTQGLIVNGRDLGAQVTDSIGSLRTTLEGVTDVDSAQRALPRLQEISAEVDRLSDSSTLLTAEQRNSLAGLVRPSLTNLDNLSYKVLAIPGVDAVLKPTLDGLLTKIRALT
jgi:hypothetical protein